jgi:hypothetical protein
LALNCLSFGVENRSRAKFCDSCYRALVTASSVAVAATSATHVRLNAEEAVGVKIEGVRTTGDGILARLGAPVSYEDHPQYGLCAAPQMRGQGVGRQVEYNPVLYSLLRSFLKPDNLWV